MPVQLVTVRLWSQPRARDWRARPTRPWYSDGVGSIGLAFAHEPLPLTVQQPIGRNDHKNAGNLEEQFGTDFGTCGAMTKRLAVVCAVALFLAVGCYCRPQDNPKAAATPAGPKVPEGTIGLPQKDGAATSSNRSSRLQKPPTQGITISHITFYY